MREILLIALLSLSALAAPVTAAQAHDDTSVSTGPPRCPADLPRPVQAACQTAVGLANCVLNSRNPLRECVRI